MRRLFGPAPLMHVNERTAGRCVVTMIRTIGLSGALAGICLLAAIGAGAEAPQTASTARAASVTIYFASGAATATPQVQALIGKIGDTAASCEADRIDLIAHIDPGVDGESAASCRAGAPEAVDQGSRGAGPAGRAYPVCGPAAIEGAPTAGFNQVDVAVPQGGSARDRARASPHRRQ